MSEITKKLFVIWHGYPSYKRVLFLIQRRKWRNSFNWKFNIKLPHINIILPFFRLVKNNGSIEIGLGNYYFVIGW